MIDPRGIRVSVLLAALILSAAGAAEAAVNAFWRELGGSASGNGVSQTPSTRYADPPSVAVGPDGRPVVAYPEQVLASEDEGAILVKRWTGAAWQLLSPAAGIGTAGYDPQVKISPAGTIYVAWLVRDEAGTQVHLRRRLPAGTIWEQLSGSDSPGGLTAVNGSSAAGLGVARNFSLAIGDDGNPLVAFLAPAQTGIVSPAAGILDSRLQVFVKRYAGAAAGWQYVGSDPAAGRGASNARSFPLTGGGYALHDAREVALAVDSAGRPAVAFSYFSGGNVPTNEEMFVTRWNGSAWTAVGPAVPQSDDGGAGRGGPGGVSATTTLSRQPSLAADPAGDRLYLAWYEVVGGQRPIYVRRWNGVSAWEELSGSASGGGIGGGSNDAPAVAVDGDGNAVVAWRHYEFTPTFLSQAFVLRSTAAGGWEEMGPDSASGEGISGNGPGAAAGAPSLAQFISPTGTPPDSTTVAWMQDRPGLVSQVYLRQFDDGPRFLLSVDVVPDGAGRLVSDPIGIRCPEESCSEFYPRGQAVRLTPIAAPDYLFDRWLGACTGGGACTATMSAPRSINASFAGAATLTVVKLGGGAAFGTVTGPGIACGGDCQEKYRLGTLVTLAVTMPTGTLFDGWGGECAFRGQNTSCALPMTANRAVSALFRQRAYDIAVTAALAPGTVGQSPVGIVYGFEGDYEFYRCRPGSACVADFAHGARLLLQATPDLGNRFLSWQGGPCAGRTNATCEFTVTGAITTTALFRGVTRLSVGKAGSGASRGLVTGPGFACGADCFEEVFTGTRITLTQAAGAGNRFLGWVGCDNPLAPTCTLLAPATYEHTIRADFRLELRHLRVTTEGLGYAQSLLPGINCGTTTGRTDCDQDYDYGTLVALTPTAGTDSMFVAWTGCSRLNGSVCLVDMTANRTVKQRYVAARRLTLETVDDGRGRITAPTTPPLVCLNPCSTSQMVPLGATVVLTPKPDTGSNFQWVNPDECTNRTGACTVRMDRNVIAGGIFRLNRHRLTVTRRFNGTVVGTVPTGTPILCSAISTSCATEQDYGTPVSLQALANDGNVFVNWTGTSPCSLGARATNASCTFPLQGNVTAIPNFRARTLVSVVKQGPGAGLVTGPGINCGADCAEAIFDGKRVSLLAAPSVGSRFTGFGGACVSATSPCAFVPAGNSQNVSAAFALLPFTLSVASRNQGVVTTLDARHEDTIACGAGTGSTDCAATWLFGFPVVLQATALDGFAFDKWTGDAVCAGKTNRTCEFRLPARNASVTPGYRARTQVTVVKQGTGAGLVTGPGINCGTDCTEAMFDAKRVTLAAAPAVGSQLTGFGGACVSSTSPCAFVPSGDNQAVTAAFALRRFTVSVARNTNGSVFSTTDLSSDIGCGARFPQVYCTARADFGALVTLEAFPEPLFAFAKWTGTVCNGSTNRTCSFRIGLADVAIAPSYRLATEVRLDKTGNGDGTVVSTPAAITCRPGVFECTADFYDGKPVTFRATPVAGSRFAGFTDACVSNTSACTFTPVGERQVVEAEFRLLRFALSVARREQGLVNTIQPPTLDILCGAGNEACATVLDYGRVRLRAVPLEGFAFVSWAGVACAGGNANAECEFTLAANTSVTPTYRRRTLVTVTRMGGGTGTVTGAGISCGADCAENVFDGRPLTLTATPAATSRFMAWDGACSISNTSTCTFVPTGDAQEASARFERQPRTVTVNIVGSGAVRGPSGTCPPVDPCVFEDLFGDTIELEPLPQGINRLLSWTGCTSVTGTLCRVLLTANRTVTARFTVSLAVRPILAGTGSVTGPGISCGADCTETYAPGTVVTLTRVFGSLSLFLGWGEACASQGTSPMCTLTLNTDQTVAANFLPI